MKGLQQFMGNAHDERTGLQNFLHIKLSFNSILSQLEKCWYNDHLYLHHLHLTVSQLSRNRLFQKGSPQVHRNAYYEITMHRLQNSFTKNKHLLFPFSHKLSEVSTYEQDIKLRKNNLKANFLKG